MVFCYFTQKYIAMNGHVLGAIQIPVLDSIHHKKKLLKTQGICNLEKITPSLYGLVVLYLPINFFKIYIL
jgi:hypothetical protein